MTEAVHSHRPSILFFPSLCSCFPSSSPSSPLPRRQWHQLPRWHRHCFMFFVSSQHRLLLPIVTYPRVFTSSSFHQYAPMHVRSPLNPQTEPNPSSISPSSLNTNPTLEVSFSLRHTLPSAYYVVVQLACQRYSHILILELSTCPHSPTAKDKLKMSYIQLKATLHE